MGQRFNVKSSNYKTLRREQKKTLHDDGFSNDAFFFGYDSKSTGNKK